MLFTNNKNNGIIQHKNTTFHYELEGRLAVGLHVFLKEQYTPMQNAIEKTECQMHSTNTNRG
jgi:hypothetical protein